MQINIITTQFETMGHSHPWSIFFKSKDTHHLIFTWLYLRMISWTKCVASMNSVIGSTEMINWLFQMFMWSYQLKSKTNEGRTHLHTRHINYLLKYNTQVKCIYNYSQDRIISIAKEWRLRFHKVWNIMNFVMYVSKEQTENTMSDTIIQEIITIQSHNKATRFQLIVIGFSLKTCYMCYWKDRFVYIKYVKL